MALKYFLILMAFFVLFSAKADISSSKLTLRVTINTITYNKYQLYEKKDVCNELPNLTTEQIDRPIIELSIICAAFKQQDVDLKIEFFETASYSRSIWLVKKGLVDIFSQTVWQADINEDYMYVSDDIIRIGEFSKGIYTNEDHPLQSIAAEEINFKKYRGMTQQTWIYDLAIINSLTDNVLKNDYFPTMFKVLSNNRADFTLMEFPAKGELSISQDGFRLQPIKGIKVVIPMARKFILSKIPDNSQFIFETLNSGIQSLRNNGEIYKRYVEAGFINKKTENWKTVNEYQF